MVWMGKVSNMNTLLDIQEGQLALICNDRLNDLAKQIPGYRYHKQSDTWRAPLSPLTVNATWSVFQGRVEVSASVTDYMNEWSNEEAVLSAISEGVFRDGMPDGIAEGLWPPQIDGAGFLATAKLAYLADDMGAGKTAQALRALRLQVKMGLDPYPALVVCNKSAIWNWPDEIEKWTPEANVFVVDGTTPQREKIIAAAREAERAILVINWEALHTSGKGHKHTRLAAYGGLALTDIQKEDGSLNGGWLRTVIADEAHKAKKWKATRTRALWAIGHGDRVVNRWAITGTPLTGEYEDLWSIGHFVDPDAFPLKTRFMQRYTVQSVGYHGGLITHGWDPSTEGELMDYFKARFIRRTKRDMRGDAYLGKLPPITRKVKMVGKQRTAYNRMKKDMLAEVDGEVFVAGSDMELYIRLGQFSAGTPKIEEVDGVMAITALQKPSCKLNALMDILMEAGDEQVVVFAQSRLLLELVETELADKKNKYTFGSIHGGASALERQASVEAFQQGDLQIMLCSYAAGSESINLNSAHIMVRLQHTYNYTHWKQAPDRLDRGEQTDYVQIIDVLTEGSAEHKVWEALDDKGRLEQSLFRDPNFQKELLDA